VTGGRVPRHKCEAERRVSSPSGGDGGNGTGGTGGDGIYFGAYRGLDAQSASNITIFNAGVTVNATSTGGAGGAGTGGSGAAADGNGGDGSGGNGGGASPTIIGIDLSGASNGGIAQSSSVNVTLTFNGGDGGKGTGGSTSATLSADGGNGTGGSGGSLNAITGVTGVKLLGYTDLLYAFSDISANLISQGGISGDGQGGNGASGGTGGTGTGGAGGLGDTTYAGITATDTPSSSVFFPLSLNGPTGPAANGTGGSGIGGTP
jgi:hypothetical protein